MKNFINYYYNLSISNIRKNSENYYFEINGIEYEFILCLDDKESIRSKYFLIINSNRYTHEIVYNINNSIYTYYNNLPYILIKKNYKNDELINLKTIIEYDALLDIKYHFNWKQLWQNKIDYYEYQVKEIGYKYYNIKQSFSYYIGLSEIAICLLNYVNSSEILPYISHKRITIKENYDSFLNPINIVIDSRIRDISEYIKINYINEKISIDDIKIFLNEFTMNNSEAILFLSRLIYPTYYFDLYDLIIQDKINDSKINYYIEKNVYYETFLKNMYKILKTKYNIPIIEWFEN